MLLTGFQNTIIEMASAKVKVGILKDKLHQAITKKDYLEAKSIKEKLVGFTEVNLHGYGERGSGKTSGTIEAATRAGFVALYLNAATWVDSADAVGKPEIMTVNGKQVTKNMIRDFFPQLKRDENNKLVTRADGGYMIDFESIKDYISNYDDLLIHYNGDINQCPGLVVVWDEFNRIVAQDVQQMMYSVMLEHKLGDYLFPTPSLFVALTNPNTGDYNVSAIMEEEAMKDRFCHVSVENSLEIYNGFMTRNNFHWSIKALANQHPETVTPKGDEYDLNIKPSNRSMHMLSSLLGFTELEKNLDKGDFQEVVSGLVGMTYAARHAEIVENGAEKVPTGEEIITNYDAVKELVVSARESNRQDFLNQVKENFLDIITKEDTIDKYGMRATKDKENNIITIPPSLHNVYKFFCDIPAEWRVELVKMFVNIPKVHPVIAMHKDLYDLVKEDIKRSNRKDKGVALAK